MRLSQALVTVTLIFLKYRAVFPSAFHLLFYITSQHFSIAKAHNKAQLVIWLNVVWKTTCIEMFSALFIVLPPQKSPLKLSLVKHI